MIILEACSRIKSGTMQFSEKVPGWQTCLPCLLLLFSQVFSSACARVGEPRPPIIYIPKASQDLEVRQIAGQMLLTVSLPRENTNGTPANTLKGVEVFRLIVDSTQNGTLLEEDKFLKGAIKIVSISEEDFPKYKRDNKLVFNDALAFQKNSEIYSGGLIYAVRFINNKTQTAGFGNRVFLVPVPIPGPPSFLPPEINQDAVRLRWNPPAENLDGSKPARIVGYNIYRCDDSKDFSPNPLNLKPLQQPEFDDRNFEFDKRYGYAVSVVASEKSPYAESLLSKKLDVTPRDTFPPGAPQNLNAVAEGGIVILLWTAPPERDVAGYRIYSRNDGSADKNLLQAGLITTLSYRDETAQPGRKYEYSVSAVDTHNNESTAASATIDLQ